MSRSRPTTTAALGSDENAASKPISQPGALVGAQFVVAALHGLDGVLLEERASAPGGELREVFALEDALSKQQPLGFQERVRDDGVQFLRGGTERDRSRQRPVLGLHVQLPVEVVAVARRRDPERPSLLAVDGEQRPCGLPDPLQRPWPPRLGDEVGCLIEDERRSRDAADEPVLAGGGDEHTVALEDEPVVPGRDELRAKQRATFDDRLHVAEQKCCLFAAVRDRHRPPGLPARDLVQIRAKQQVPGEEAGGAEGLSSLPAAEGAGRRVLLHEPQQLALARVEC